MVHEPVINYEDLINITEQNLTRRHFENPYPTLSCSKQTITRRQRNFLIRQKSGVTQRSIMSMGVERARSIFEFCARKCNFVSSLPLSFRGHNQGRTLRDEIRLKFKLIQSSTNVSLERFERAYVFFLYFFQCLHGTRN